MTSNNSPLLKDSQELTKTKGTIWKPLIAVSLLSVFSFISGQYLPYVIIAVSGSGAIAAVPLAIFAVSTVVALISTIYLIRLAVSRADNKKEEPQKFVCENCTNLDSEPIGEEHIKQDNKLQTEVRGSEHVDTSPKLTPQQPPLTLGTAIPQNNNAPPPPSPLSSGAPPPPPPPPSFQNSSTQPSSTGLFAEMGNVTLKKTNPPVSESGSGEKLNSALLEQIKGGVTLKKVSSNESGQQQDFTNGLEAKLKSSGGTDKKETPEEYAARIEKNLEERKSFTMRNAQDHHHDVASIMARRTAMEFSDSESERSSSSDDSGWTADEDKDKQKEQKKKVRTKHKRKSTSSTLQSTIEKEAGVLTVVMDLVPHLRHILHQRQSHRYRLSLLIHKRNLKLLLQQQ